MNGTERINWSRYYQDEPKVNDLTPGRDQVEIHRCRLAESLLPGRGVSSVLDVGCGDGYFCHYIQTQRTGLAVTGVDLATARLQRARARYRAVNFCQCEISHLPFGSGGFDVVTCIEVLEHLDQPEAALTELARVASKWVAITVPYKEHLRESLCPHCGKTYPANGHVQSFDEQRLKQIAQSIGLRVERLKVYYPLHGQTIGLPLWFQRVEAFARRILGGSGTFLGARLAKI
jgi:ubiquinone/menaquinone biosynthesis C-methylase UbiE